MAQRPRMSAEEKAWRAQDDMRTLLNAQKIRNDQERMRAVDAEVKKQNAALAQISKTKSKSK